MIATCDTCRQPMDGRSCTDERAWPWGVEPGWPVGEIPAEACRDCGTPVGGNHHPGCCVAICRICGDQALACLADGEHARTH
jgi:hypothetical protein